MIVWLVGFEVGVVILCLVELVVWMFVMCVIWVEMFKIVVLICYIEDLYVCYGCLYILRVGILFLFCYIEGVYGERFWGIVLDVGIGVKLFQWIQILLIECWMVVMVVCSLVDKICVVLGSVMCLQDCLFVGNWVDDSFFVGEMFDIILVDYLVGVIEGFVLYWQDCVFEWLCLYFVDYGCFYLVGLEFYV